MSASGGFLNLGRDIIADALIGGGTYDAYNNTNMKLAVGDSDTAYAASQTDLQGSSTVRLDMESGSPSRSSNVISFEAIADGSTANFEWKEWGIVNASTGGEMLCRFTQALGTKASGTTWNASGDLTIVLPS